MDLLLVYLLKQLPSYSLRLARAELRQSMIDANCDPADVRTHLVWFGDHGRDIIGA